MADKIEYMFVTVGPKCPKDHVALQDWDTDHPKTREFPNGGEAFVASGIPRFVAKTPKVLGALHEGKLKEITEAEALKDPRTPKALDDQGQETAYAKAVSAPADATIADLASGSGKDAAKNSEASVPDKG